MTQSPPPRVSDATPSPEVPSSGAAVSPDRGIPGATSTLSKASTTAAPPADDALPARDKLVITLLLISAFVVILNETIMGVAIPRLVQELGVTVGAGQWLTTAFLLTMAVVIPVTGFLLHRFNTRPVFLAAMTLFSLGTLIAALAPGFGMLVAGRVVQASGTAIMMPLLMTTVMTLVPVTSRGKVMGNISIVIAVAPALGPTISGGILSVLEWRWIFWLVLPIALAALAIGAAKMQNVTTPRRSAIDVLSVILSAFAFGGIIFGFSRLGEASEGSAVPPWLPLVAGLVILAVFVGRQLSLQRRDAALLDLRVFSSRNFTISLTAIAVSMMALFGTIILIPIYVQTVLGQEPFVSGLLLLPGGLAMGLLGPVVGRIYDRRGPRVLLVPGSLLVSAVFWAMTQVTETTPVLLVLAAHVVLSIGLALIFTPLLTSALGSVKPQLYSHGSAVFGTAQQLAGAAGTALFISVMTLQTAALTAEGAAGPAAMAGGIRAAFLYGAVIFLVAVVASFFVRAPQNAGDAPVAAH
ncbi:multidrug efflux MFS transporter [Arthrobacter agilis]|uniref:DHA2 family efflux MFS transporter permease subunit n=1 Tax=Arthrobacter agilis TaxID=37921 RepID=UPI000B364313|nr:DHA2 family efflux MFS transporter permease subunit [Arthrobacter agilis]OUM45047.1 MFS transporter [Arthrobacter agilis]PPB46888.1 MFS transporter [Arthrobacter agilis]TPV23520.1 multidrug efflux MFS transporter [Arthrobacter agilis]VDR31918.1 High-copy suppressor of rspA [Arthrobacter agilis]